MIGTQGPFVQVPKDEIRAGGLEAHRPLRADVGLIIAERLAPAAVDRRVIAFGLAVALVQVATPLSRR